MKWEQMKELIENCVPESILDNYDMSIELSIDGTIPDKTRIEIDNNKHEIFVTEI